MSAQRVAIVTGSNKGIGFAIVRALCKKFEGDVFLTARNEGRGNTAVNALEKEGLHPKFHSLDVTDQKSVATLVEFIRKEYGGVDVLVHNAAIAFKSADPAPFAEQARVTVPSNFTATIKLCESFLPLMRDEGRIAIVSSMSSTMSLKKCSKENQAIFKSPDLTVEKLVQKLDEFVEAAQTGAHIEKGFPGSAYGMSKLGVTAYTRILARKVQEMGKSNILVNCCCPGYVITDMTSHKGTKTPDEGAETPVHIALLPKGSKPTGEFFSDKQVRKWYS
ncbi:carbonyl reductase [NADPH] 1-like [Styela clava]